MITAMWAESSDPRPVIARRGEIPWRVPEDLQRFQGYTRLHKNMIMGRKTWESLPDSIKDDPDRRCIVVSRTMPLCNPVVVRSVEEAIEAADGKAVVIGGTEIIMEAMPYIERLCVTEVNWRAYLVDDPEVGRVTFAPVIDDSEWKIDTEPRWRRSSSGTEFAYVHYIRRSQDMSGIKEHLHAEGMTCRECEEQKLRVEHLGPQQPKPTATGEPSAHDLVIADMAKRREFGLAKYGTLLQASNGRDNLQDAYEEVLDLAVYLRNEIERRRVAEGQETLFDVTTVHSIAAGEPIVSMTEPRVELTSNVTSASVEHVEDDSMRCQSETVIDRKPYRCHKDAGHEGLHTFFKGE